MSDLRIASSPHDGLSRDNDMLLTADGPLNCVHYFAMIMYKGSEQDAADQTHQRLKEH